MYSNSADERISEIEKEIECIDNKVTELIMKKCDLLKEYQEILEDLEK